MRPMSGATGYISQSTEVDVAFPLTFEHVRERLTVNTREYRMVMVSVRK
jgi:hypothetical protein